MGRTKRKFEDLTGRTFGNWLVIEYVGIREIGTAKVKKDYWKCQCQCENKTVREVSANSLKSGTSKSCGCLKVKSTIERCTIHGFARRGKNGSSIYHVWHMMKARCSNPNNKQYANYGGRGIKVCEEWNQSFISFKDWAFENGYKIGLTIDRIDVNKGYSPDNCRWVDYKTQANNTRSNVNIEYNGEIKTIAQWCDELNVNPQLVYSRIDSYGWEPLEALTSPLRNNIPVICYDEQGNVQEYSNVKEASKIVGVSENAIRTACRRKKYKCRGYYWRYKYATRTKSV